MNEESSCERKRERERTEVDDNDIERCVRVLYATREERMARGLLGRVAKEEKIRGFYAVEVEDNR